jgi:hypothetical protein
MGEIEERKKAWQRKMQEVNRTNRSNPYLNPTGLKQDSLNAVTSAMQGGAGITKHQHQFTIPVAWKYIDTKKTSVTSHWPEQKEVTKLRCPCGEEIER